MRNLSFTKIALEIVFAYQCNEILSMARSSQIGLLRISPDSNPTIVQKDGLPFSQQRIINIGSEDCTVSMTIADEK
jgi:hypothetical protein